MEGACQYLQSRRVLLVLDNCEHLIESVAGLCDVLLRRCPHLRILATSREALQVAGEVIWRVPSLSLPPSEAAVAEDISGDAVALFCERARAVDPDFSLTDDNAVAVARICLRLDGIPLALELAAARLRVLRPDQVADRLDDRFRLLTGGTRGALPRHKTLRATMDWSYDLLSGPERTLLRRLSVFSGSFSLEAAESVGADGVVLTSPEILGVLGPLIDKSLVGLEPGGREARYRLLETVREYASEKLAEAEDEDAARGRHLDFFLHRLEEHGPDVFSDEWCSLSWLGADRDNVRAAVQWSLAVGDAGAFLPLAAALWGYWTLEGQLFEGCTALEYCLARASGPLSAAHVRVMNTLGFLYLQRGETGRAAVHLEEALAAGEAIGDAAGAAWAGALLGMVALQRGELDEANALLQKGTTFLEATDPPLGAWCRFNLAWVAMARGDLQRAGVELETVLHFGQRTGNDNLVAHAVSGLAPLLALGRNLERAEELADLGIAAARRLGLRRVLVMALTRAAEVATLLGQGHRAEILLRESLPLLRDIGGRAWVADSVEMTALVLGSVGRHRPAARLLGAGEALRHASGESAAVRSIHAEVERQVDQAARVLGPEDFAEEWRRGAEMPSEEAVVYALAELQSAS